MHCLDVAFALILGVDENIIQINNDKDIEFFCEDLIDVALECCRSIGQSKKYYLILKVVVSGPESSFPLISFVNSHPVIGTMKTKLGKLPYSPQSIEGLSNQRQWISVLDCEVIKSPIINTNLEAAFWLLIKKNVSSY